MKLAKKFMSGGSFVTTPQPETPPWEIIPVVSGSTYDTWEKITNASNQIVGTGTWEVTSFAGSGIVSWFANELMWEYPTVYKQDIYFTIDSMGDGFSLHSVTPEPRTASVDIFGGNLRLMSLPSTVVDTTPVSNGDDIKIIIEQGKIEVFVNEVSEMLFEDVAVTFSDVRVSFRGDFPCKVTNIKTIIYL